MRNIARLLLAPAIVIAQVAFQVPLSATASAATTAAVAGTSPNIVIALTIATPDPLKVTDKLPAPDYDSQVLAPLRAAQAAQAQADAEAVAAAQAAALAAQQAAQAAAAQAAIARAAYVAEHTITYASADDEWYALRMCEAGNDYTRNSGNGYYGAYQYNLGTWGGYDGYARPDLAPPDVQDAKAHETQSARGWTPWPACSHKLGLR
jgi:hypothetical protein